MKSHEHFSKVWGLFQDEMRFDINRKNARNHAVLRKWVQRTSSEPRTNSVIDGEVNVLAADEKCWREMRGGRIQGDCGANT